MIKKILILLLVLSMRAFGDAHILMYHRIGDSRHPSTNVSVEAFEKQLRFLEDNGYEIVELSRIVEAVRDKRELNDKWVAITIDDAYKSFYENGLPLLKERGYPFTLFVNTQAVERRYGDYMTWKMIEDSSRYGEIGGHSHTHSSMPKIDKQQMREELKLNKKLLEERIGEMRYFAYPYGEYSKEVADEVENLGYKGAFKQVMGAVSTDSNLYTLNRIPMGEKTNLRFFLSMNYLPARWERVDIEGDILKGMKVTLPEEAEKVEVFLSGYGWEWTRVEKSYIRVDKKLLRSRNNIIIRDSKNRYSDYLILR
ncbi:hypothetical protein PM10SUCC1_05350 [Propionigenium maris DSM 9537]|uniref:NodB homology domain-containing protein n=1 Tax=Propionigenium maris DSM 9537 TaxID=1123000 RepID=A0A9W6GJB2_9FUSO|nr:polysaccharide deacetylase family protein [Propionigenium maris]GLI55020.1 hypothetical protein PM10SUCC1_05350 [Propionigenium maris DSM 9537]